MAKKNTTLLDLMFGKKKLVKYKPPKKKEPSKQAKTVKPKIEVNNKTPKRNVPQTSKELSNVAPEERSKQLSQEKKDKRQKERWKQGKDKLTTGISAGATEALIPFSDYEKDKPKEFDKIKDSTSYKAGKALGFIGATGLTFGVAGGSKAVTKGAEKLATNKLGTKATQKLATSKGVRAIAEKKLKTAGKEITEDAIKAETDKVAKGIVKTGAKDLILDSTAGVYINNNAAVNDGKKIGSKEWAKEMALNTGLDIGIGGAINAVPVIKNTAKALKGATTAKRLGTDGKLHNVRVLKTKAVSDAPVKANLPQTYKVKKANSRNELVVKNASKAVDTPKTTVKPKPEPIPKEVEYADVKTANEGSVYNDAIQRREEVGKAFDEAYENEVKQVEDYVRNYEPKGVDYNFRYNRTNDNAIAYNRGYASRTSNNDKWYQDFWKKNGRRPNKNESRQIAEQIVNEQLDFIRRGGANDGEFPVSDELATLIKHFDYLDNQVKSMEKGGYADSIFTSKDVPEVEDMYKDVPTPEPIPKELDEPNAIGARAMPNNEHDLNVVKYGEKNGVPNATAYGETTKGVQTMVGGNVLDDESKEMIKASVDEGNYAKVTVPNSVVLDNAKAMVDENTNKAYESLISKLDNGKQAKSEDIATAEELIVKFQEMRSQAKSKGDMETYQYFQDKIDRVARDTCTMAGESARTLQAMRLFNSLSPAGKEYSVKKAVSKISEETGVENLNVNPDLLENLLKADSIQTTAKAKKAIITDVWNQIPPTWTKKANAWRYLAMLGNPKTHIRNVLGNAIFVPVKGMRNVLATGLEKAFVEEGKRTKAILTHSDENLIELGSKDFNSVKDWISGGSRYIEGVRDFDAKQFNNSVLNWLYQKNSKLLEKEDELFMGIAYKRAYAQYLKSKGIKATDEIAQDLLDGAREYATKEALNSTYRDVSTLADMISEVKKYASMETSAIPVKAYDDTKTVRRAQLAKKAAGIAVEATMPFTKTPINILRRGIDYSPLGIVKSIGNMLNAKGNTDELIKAIENFSSGLTGTGILMAGYFAGRHGFAEGSIDTTSDEGRYKQMMGEQSYSIRVGDYTYTMDWAVPSAMAFFVGVNLANETEDIGFEKAMNVMSQITDPVFNLSMLSGINTVLGDTASSFKSTNAMVQTLENTLKSYLGQYVPTFGGQIARSITPYKKSATSTNETAFGRQTKSFINQQANKIPFANFSTANYVDNWGNKDKTDWYDRVQNFISPGTLKKVQTSEVDRELQSLGERLPSSEYGSIVPKYTSSTDFTQEFGNNAYRMSEKQLEQFKTIRGQQSYKLMRELINTDSYKNMTDDEKMQAIQDCYRQAKDIAVREFLKENGVSEKEYIRSKLTNNQAKAFDKSKMSVKKYDELNSIKNSFTKNTSDLRKAYRLYNAGATRTELEVMGSGVSGHRMNTIKSIGRDFTLNDYEKAMAYKEQDENGRLSRDEIIEYLESTNLSQTEKYYMYNALASWRNAYKKNPY